MTLLAGDAGYGATASLNQNFAAGANVANSPLQIQFDGYVERLGLIGMRIEQGHQNAVL